jgi:hypothetical protein
MEFNDLVGMLSQGSVFAIETDKTINMAEGAPSPMMLKVSHYHITTRLPSKPEGEWWQYTKTPSVVVKKGPTPRLYLLCAMYKGAGFGRSSFYALNTETGEFDMDNVYSKSSLAKYLPAQEPFNADYMTLPIDSIQSLTPVDKPVTPKPEDKWEFPDHPMNEKEVKPVDESNESVWPWPMVEKDPVILDHIVDSGTLYVLAESRSVSWGKTAEDAGGLTEIVVDAPEATPAILGALLGAGVIKNKKVNVVSDVHREDLVLVDPANLPF